MPRKVVEEARVLAKLPRLLRAWVRFAYAERGLSRELLADALGAIDHWEPDYQRLIRTPRAQGAEAIARMAMGLDTGLELDVDPWRDHLIGAVGTQEALDALTDEPLPDEPFDWTGLPDRIRPKLEEIVALCDANADDLLDVEHRTAIRRLLHDVATAQPGYFLGHATARTSAAAIIYMIAHANDSVGIHRDVTVGELLAPFGVASASQRVGQFRRFLGLSEHDPSVGAPMVLGSAAYLVAERRAELMADREAPWLWCGVGGVG